MGELYIFSLLLILFPVFHTAAKRARSSDEAATEQEQAGWFGDFVRTGSKSTDSPLVNILKCRATQALDRDAVDNGAFRRFDTEEILTIGADREDLVEHLTARERVVDCELDLRWRGQAGRDVDVQNELGERCAILELNSDVRKRCVAGAADEHGLAAAHAEVAIAGRGSEINDKARAGAVEIALHECPRVNETAVVE